MAQFKEITPQEITENPFKLIGSDWALVTSGSRESFNTMTVSWGGAGIMWNKPVVFTFIRPQRYTYEFTEKNSLFTMSFFDESYRSALAFCGSKSGRDVDKVKETGLTAAFTREGAPYFEEAKLVLVCKKLYAQDLTGDSIVEPFVNESYSGNDYHRMYVAEIVKVFTKS